jgi:hypothetical protein
MNLEAIQAELQKVGIDGRLFFDHHERDPLAYRVLGLKPPGHVSRRWYYFIPARGEPRGLVHQVEPHVLDPLPGARIPYARWQEQEAGLRQLLQDARRVAMQYSLAFCGNEVPERMREAFAVVVGARDAGIKLVREAMAAGRTLRGFEVDDAVAGHIQNCGYGPNTRHRTGHSIGREVHGVGANMDNLETHDERPIIPWTCFSIEPALYLPDFGVRTEINLFVEARSARVTGEMQQEFVRL